ncbi:MAG: type II secretion system secretin GspD [Woeseiaceae bacterium]|nr:type II secretion system secretin GspD [Woeseiaceae bacterium]
MAALAALVIMTSSATSGQEQAITPNYKEVDIRTIAETAAELTGRTIIIDPRVTGQKVTMVSSTPMSPDVFYEAFLSILEVHQYAAVTTGNIVKIIPNATARQYPGPLGATSADGADDIITQVIQVNNVGAAQLVPILRPLVPQYGHLVAHPGSNMLIISDRAANVARMISIIRRIDQAGDEDIEVVPLQHASAAEVVRVMTTLTQQPRADGAPVTTSLVADPRTNSVLIGGDKNDRLRLRALLAHLDTPLEDGGDTQVRYLQYADAEELATKLQQHYAAQQTAGAGAGAGAAAASTRDPVTVWADTQTNAIVVSAPPKVMRSLMSIVDQLDIRREQVLVEAIIVEIIGDSKAELGVTWAVEGTGSNTPIGVTNFPSFGPGVVQLGSALGGDGGVPADGSGLIGEGITMGVGRISDSGVSFAAILRALQGDADTNIISTPSILTTDNEEASLNVGQEVPFVSGSFTNTGGAGGAVNPFTTVQRQSVGVKLTITPQINEGDALLLEISQEISNIASSSEGAVDLITNQRIIETTVIVDDGSIIVLGGLIDDVLRESEQRVPVLGSIPLLGTLFRSKKTELAKTNLMVFIRPKILRDAESAYEITNQKYNQIRNIQLGNQGEAIPLMPGIERPAIPPIDLRESATPADSSDGGSE